MCGIVGFMGHYTGDVWPVFKSMLIFDTIRGIDGTGVAAVLNNHYLMTAKGPSIPWYLFYNDAFRKIETHKHNPICLIGHNRAATKGTVSTKNAHPFTHGHITLVHNGTIHNHKQLLKDSNHEFETDSEAICWSLSERGVDETWKLLFGAANLVWWDSQENTLNMVVNGKRPGFGFAYTKGETKLFFASETWMFEVACKRRNIELDDTQLVNSDYLISFSYNQKTMKVIESSRKLETSYKGYKTIWGYDGNDLGYGNQVDYNKERHNDLLGNKLPWLKEISEDKFYKRYKLCYACNSSLEGQYETAEIIDDNNALCESCVDFCTKEGISLDQLRFMV